MEKFRSQEMLWYSVGGVLQWNTEDFPLWPSWCSFHVTNIGSYQYFCCLTNISWDYPLWYNFTEYLKNSGPASLKLFLCNFSLPLFVSTQEIQCLILRKWNCVPVKGEIIWYLSLTSWLISLSIMLSSFIHGVAKGISSFFLSDSHASWYRC